MFLFLRSALAYLSAWNFPHSDDRCESIPGRMPEWSLLFPPFLHRIPKRERRKPVTTKTMTPDLGQPPPLT
jgi:hypothetical protein